MECTYHRCQTFKDFIERDKVELLAQRQRALQSLEAATNVKGASRQRSTAKTKIRLIDGRLLRIQDPNRLTLHQLLTVLMDCDGTLWTDEERTLNQQPTLSYEGYGEKALRARHSIIDGPTQFDCDLPGLNEEIKSWEVTTDLGSIASFKVGAIGMKMFGRVKRSIIRSTTDAMLDESMWEAFDTGEVSAGKLYNTLPEHIRNELQRELAPSKVLGKYAAINGTTSMGFLRVPAADYDRAFRLVCITKMSPKYILRRDYVESRLGIVSAS